MKKNYKAILSFTLTLLRDNLQVKLGLIDKEHLSFCPDSQHGKCLLQQTQYSKLIKFESVGFKRATLRYSFLPEYLIQR